jgi:hypothetical protein
MHGRQLGPFVLARREPLQLGYAVLQLGALRLARLVALFRLQGDFLQAPPVAESVRGVARERLAAGMGIEQLALRGGAQQRLVRMLPVDVHEQLARLPELRQRGGVPVDEAAGAPGAVEAAAQDQQPRVAGQVALFQPRQKLGAGVHLELGGELGALAALPDQARVAAPAHQQLDGVDQQGLAGAGFAGEDGEAAGELERGALDDDQVPDVERPQHGYSRSGFLTSASLQRSFSRSVAKYR